MYKIYIHSILSAIPPKRLITCVCLCERASPSRPIGEFQIGDFLHAPQERIRIDKLHSTLHTLYLSIFTMFYKILCELWDCFEVFTDSGIFVTEYLLEH